MAGVANALTVGMTVDAASTMVQLMQITAGGTPIGAIGTVFLGVNETTSVNAFRCNPYGTFCFFLTWTTSGNTSNSFLYNVTASSASLISRTMLPGVVAYNLHLDHATGGAVTIGFDSKSTTVLSVLNGQVVPVVDLTPFLSSTSYIIPGGTTQCSNTETVYVSVHSGSTAPDTLLTVSMLQKKVVNVTVLQQEAFTTWWADCNDATSIDYAAGAFMDGRLLTYGEIRPSGAMQVWTSGLAPALPANLQLSGLIYQDAANNVYMAVYPPGLATGFLAVGQFQPNTSFTFIPINYYLTGAATIS
jgi:hypothetical protein